MAAPPVTAALLGLPATWRVTGYEVGDQVLSVTACTDERPAGPCPRCGREQWQRSGQQARVIRGEQVAGRTLIGQVTYVRWRCACGGSRMPESLEALGKREATTRLTERLTRLALQHTNSDAARLAGINTQTAKGILAQTLPRLLEGYVVPAARYVGVDICRHWLLIVDLETGRRLEARRLGAPGALATALAALPWVPEVVVSDMERQVVSAIRAAWPSARLVVDRFHVEQRVWVTVERVLRDSIQRGLFSGHHVTLRGRGQQGDDPALQALLDWRNAINTLFKTALTPAALRAALEEWLTRVPDSVARDKRVKQLLALLRGLAGEIAEYAAGQFTNGVTEALNKSVALLHQHGASLGEAAMRAKLLCRPLAVDLQAEEQRLQAEINEVRARLSPRRRSNGTPLSTPESETVGEARPAPDEDKALCPAEGPRAKGLGPSSRRSPSLATLQWTGWAVRVVGSRSEPSPRLLSGARHVRARRSRGPPTGLPTPRSAP
ncbi:transposase [Deinococcus sp. NW-56]|uniref:transposase n=1 Tax=Deinococcus sp. NW-56 TaxID=2080419 RepID=UPI000CF4049B|nr:transposase [Deinococcus sp. NW-56]